MEKEIILLNNQGRNCREDVIATAVKYMGNNYELMYSESWGFDLKDENEDGTLGSRIAVDWGDLYHLIHKYNGIDIIEKQCNSPQESYNVIKNVIAEGGIVGFTMDAHWCPWSSLYQIGDYHVVGHTILGYKMEKNGEICCIDCLPVNYGVKVPINHFMKGNNGKVILFRRIPIERNEIDYKKIIERAVAKLQRKGKYGNAFDTIRTFSTIFPEIHFENECTGYGVDDFWNSNLFTSILNIGNGRKQFGSVLKYLSEIHYNNELEEVAQQLNYISGKWLGIRGCLIKAKMTGLNSKWMKRITDMLIYIANFEEDLVNRLIKQIDNKEGQTEKIGVSNAKVLKNIIADKSIESNETKIIKLNQYFNNKGFDKVPSANSLADLTSTGDYLLEEGLPLQGLFNIDGIQYKVSVDDEAGYDNICCEGQVIKTDFIKANKIGILACAEWGDFYDKVEVCYVDSTKEEFYFQLNDWCKIPADGIDIAWRAKAVFKKNEEFTVYEEQRYISLVVSDLNIEKEISKIILPNCQNIHIFSISLM